MDWNRIVIAYQPIWANGVGQTITAAKVKEAVGYIRVWMEEYVSMQASQIVRVLYGGPVNKDNAKEYIGFEDIDGFFITNVELQEDLKEIV